MFPKVATLVPAVRAVASRNLSVSAVAFNKVDPIQQLFLNKSKEYYTKKA